MSDSAAGRNAFHPDLRRYAPFLPRSIFTSRTLPALRVITRLSELRTPPEVARFDLPGGGTVRLHLPPSHDGSGAALLWIHGGGYVIGSAAQDDALCQRFARALRVPVAAVDYRLAPKHPYPAAVHDCHEALEWLAAAAGVDRSRVVIAGASAGGGLTAALALLARDRGVVQPLFQLLVYPMVDDRSSDGPRDRHHRMWTPVTNRLGWEAYLGTADKAEAVPSRRDDLAGVAPAWVGVGTLDPLHDEGVAYAHALREAGVPCELDIVEGAFHGFDAVLPWTPVAKKFFDRQCAVIEAALG